MRIRLFAVDPRFLLWALLVAAFLLGLKEISDPDALLHLSMGRLLVETRAFPQVEPFCYPAEGTPFLYTSWLFATICFLGYTYLGGSALSVGVALAVVVLVWIVYADAHLLTGTRHSLGAALVILATILFAEDRFVLRPEIIQYVAFAFITFLLGRFTFENDRRGLWFIPVVALIWGNSHSSVILLFVPFGAFAAYLFAAIFLHGDEDRRKTSIGQLKLMGFLGALSLSAAICNPNGLSQFGYGQSVMKSDLYKQLIIELMAPRSKELWVIWPTFLISSGLSVVCLRWKALPYLLINLAALFVGLSAIRFFGFFCLVQAPILGRCAVLLTERWGGQLRKSFVVGGAVLLIIGFAVLKAGSFPPFQRDAISDERFGVGYNIPADFADAIEYLNNNRITGRVFNIFEDGQAIIWHGWPKLSVFIDGRGAIPEPALEAYRDAFDDRTVMSQLQQKYGFEIILLRRYENFQFNPHGATGFFANSDWEITYFDRQGYIFVRKEGPYNDVLSRTSYKNIIANADLKTYRDLIEGRPAYASGLLNDLQNAPSSLNDFDLILMGLCYYRLGDFSRAADSFAKVQNVSSLSLSMYGNSLFSLGRYKEAVEVFSAGLERYGAPEFRQGLQKISEMQGK